MATAPTGAYEKTSSASPGAVIAVSTGVGWPSASRVILLSPAQTW